MTGETYTPLAMLAKLVGFDTESHKSNLPLIDFVEAYLKGWGLAPLRIPNATGDKAALFVSLGPAGDGGVLLSGHTDVVPVEGQPWSSDPYKLRIADGRAYGRGAVDMKGFCATALALVPDFLQAGLKAPIHIFLSYDEETTCLGVVDGIARMVGTGSGKDLPRPDAVIVGEPTELEVIDAHKGLGTFTTLVTGQEAHSAKPYLGASAVMAACDLVAELNRLQAELIARGDPSGRFDPPYSTIHVGTIHGGTARNILARECRFNWEVRTLPDLDEAEIPRRLAERASALEAHMRKTAPNAKIESVHDVAVPALIPRHGSPAETLAMNLAGRNATGTVSYVTEGGHFQNAGLPTVICGPGSIDQAHQADEYITLDDLAAGEDFLRRLARTLA